MNTTELIGLLNKLPKTWGVGGERVILNLSYDLGVDLPCAIYLHLNQHIQHQFFYAEDCCTWLGMSHEDSRELASAVYLNPYCNLDLRNQLLQACQLTRYVNRPLPYRIDYRGTRRLDPSWWAM